MFDLPTDLPADIVPLSWLLGVWEGTGVIDYEADGTRFDGEFAHRVSFSHDGGDYVICDICPRRNYVIRRASNLSKESHIIAANVDQADRKSVV